VLFNPDYIEKLLTEHEARFAAYDSLVWNLLTWNSGTNCFWMHPLVQRHVLRVQRTQ